MENSLHEEPVRTVPAEGIGERVWKRVARQLDSTVVVRHWDKAILRIAQEARPDHTQEQLQRIAGRWHFLARSMGIAASTVDIVVASIFVGIGVKTLTGIRRFSPIDPTLTPNLYEHMAGGKTPEVQRRDDALRQIASGSPLLALAGATVALRPAKLGLSLAGKATGVAGENVSRIIRRITRSPFPSLTTGRESGLLE